MKKSEIINGILHISENDPKIGGIIERAGQFTVKAHKDYYPSLLRAIIGQQLSMKAADSIIRKFESYFHGIPTPELIIETGDEMLRSLGLSNAKVKYVKDLSGRIIDGSLHFRGIDRMSDEQIIEMLTRVKGIGVWTAHMFLIFTMCRPNVLPIGDLGIKRAVMLTYGLSTMPTEMDVLRIATENNWQPYCTIASWYLWKSLEI